MAGDRGGSFNAARYAAAGLAAMVATVGLLTGTSAASSVTTPAAGVVGSTEILVSVEPGTDLRTLTESTGATLVRGVPGRADVVVLSAPSALAGAVAARLNGRDDITFAAPNAIASMAAATNDPLLSRQWHLLERSKAAGSANWLPVGSAALGSGAAVAILDTGVTLHEDIDGVLAGMDLVDGDADASDPHGHGTHIAGTVAETAGNGVGAAGVAPGASILPVRVLDTAGNAPYDRVFSGLAYAVEAGVDVINLSLAGPVDSGICDAVGRAVDAGVIVVAATGNDSGPVGYPAACAKAIGVGAVTLPGVIAPYSNTGPGVALVAPGGDPDADLNLDLDPDGILQYSVFDGRPGYYYSAGTSMASPHVAGAAAIVRSIRPGASPDQVRQVLTSTATDKGLSGYDTIYGAGLLDIAAVVVAANALPASAPAAAPAPSPAPSPQPEPAPATSPSPTPAPSSPPSSEPAPQPAPSEPAPAPVPDPSTQGVERLFGTDRFATAAAVSAASFDAGTPHVWLATGTGFADALSTGAAAGRQNGPLLLVESCGMPSSTAGELSRLRPAAITVVGGQSAVCEGVLDHARSLTGVQPSRIAGVDRFDTAAALSRTHWSGGAQVAHLASGIGFADALSGGALGASADGPLLLTGTCDLPASSADELARLRPTEVVVMGGPAAICDGVLDQVRARTGATVTRVAGDDRFDTAASASGRGFPGGADTVFIASGAGFADGLAAGAAAASGDAPLLLVPSCGPLPTSVRTELGRLGASKVFAVGGPAAICDELLDQLAPA